MIGNLLLLLLLFVVVIALLFLAVVVIIIICVACGCGYYYYLLLLRPIWRHVWLVIGGQLHLLDAIGGQRRLLDDAKVDTHGAAMPVGRESAKLGGLSPRPCAGPRRGGVQN